MFLRTSCPISSFRALFNAWGYDMSEDTELSSAYLTISDLGPDDVKTKLNILIDALKNHLEYPLVAAAILASFRPSRQMRPST